MLKPIHICADSTRFRPHKSSSLRVNGDCFSSVQSQPNHHPDPLKLNHARPFANPTHHN